MQMPNTQQAGHVGGFMNYLIMRSLPNNGQVMYDPLMIVMFSHDIVVLLFYLYHLSHTTSLPYCCADSFILMTHYCSDCLPIVPTFFCVISFLENLSSLVHSRYDCFE